MIIFIERNFLGGTDIREYFYNTDTSSFFYNLVDVDPPEFWPEDGTVLATICTEGDLTTYTYDSLGASPDEPHFDESYLVITVEVGSASCCSLTSSQFSLSKVNNTNLLVPNGSINISSSFYAMEEFEASVDGGATFAALPLTGLAANTYTVILRHIDTPCTVLFLAVISYINDLPVPHLGMAIIETPDTFVPVFLPIIYKFQLLNNTVSIKSDGRAYIDAIGDADIIAFLSTLPYLRLIGGTIYDGNVKVTDVDNDITPTKFYISNLTYSVDSDVNFVPIDRQVFQLFGETDINVFTKIADISVAADTDGIFSMRCEGFLQSLFEVEIPATGDDLSLGRKFYCIPRDYDLLLGSDETNPILTAVYATVDISNYDDALVPLGPSPINFIDPEGKGYPTIFSYLNQDNQRVSNVRSGAVNEFVSAGDTIYFQALPGNTYTIQWISGLAFTPSFSPALPDWITIIEETDTSITIKIETFTGGDVGDYGGDDYSSLDYSIDQLNAITGCYTFEMFDNATMPPIDSWNNSASGQAWSPTPSVFLNGTFETSAIWNTIFPLVAGNDYKFTFSAVIDGNINYFRLVSLAEDDSIIEILNDIGLSGETEIIISPTLDAAKIGFVAQTDDSDIDTTITINTFEINNLKLTFTLCIFPTQYLQNICGPDLYNITWVNQQGGWNSFIFKGVKKHGRNVSKVSTYKKLHELKKSSVEEVYDQVEVGFSMKNQIELAFITMLRTSIQAYLYNDATLTWDIPIVIDKSNFPTYQTPFRQGDQQGSFTFKYANEVLIQRQ